MTDCEIAMGMILAVILVTVGIIIVVFLSYFTVWITQAFFNSIERYGKYE